MPGSFTFEIELLDDQQTPIALDGLPLTANVPALGPLGAGLVLVTLLAAGAALLRRRP